MRPRHPCSFIREKNNIWGEDQAEKGKEERGDISPRAYWEVNSVMGCEAITTQTLGMSPLMSQGHECIWILWGSRDVKHFRNCRVSAIFQIQLAGRNGIASRSVESSSTIRAHRHWHKINTTTLACSWRISGFTKQKCQLTQWENFLVQNLVKVNQGPQDLEQQFLSKHECRKSWRCLPSPQSHCREELRPGL